jgi:hypothetical protein
MNLTLLLERCIKLTNGQAIMFIAINIPSDVMTIITTADVGFKTSKVVMIHNIRGLFNSLPVSE